MENEELQALCETWQKRLRIQDWRVVCKLVHINEMKDLYNNAHNDFDLMNRQSVITIAYPGEAKLDFPNEFPALGVEELLVHELVHIVIEDLKEGDQRTEERIVQQLAEALTQ